MGGLKLSGDSAGAVAGAGDAALTAPPPGADAAASSKLSEKRSSAFGHVLEDVAELDNAKVTAAVAQEKKKRKTEKLVRSLDDERNRAYSSLGVDTAEVSPEEYEAYRLTKMRSDDPMAKFM